MKVSLFFYFGQVVSSRFISSLVSLDNEFDKIELELINQLSCLLICLFFHAPVFYFLLKLDISREANVWFY